MNDRRKKELMESYKNRCPEKGVIAYKCIETGESFLGASNDIKADFNSTTMKLTSGYHPNRRLLELWKKYGKSGFELLILETWTYEDPHENYDAKLEELRAKYLELDSNAKKIWR